MNADPVDSPPPAAAGSLAAVMSGLLLAMLDQSIVGTALPTIVETLGGSDLYVWVATAYLVPATVSLPIYARLSDRHGRRALLLIGMVLFLPAPALAATAQNMEQLIAYRALQGLGAGALEGLSFILVADLFAGRRTAALQGALAGLMGVSFIAGPLVGRLPHRPRRLALGLHRQPPDRAAALAVVATVLPASVGPQRAQGTPLDLAGHRAADRSASGCCSSASASARGADRRRPRGDRGLPGGRAPRGRADHPAASCSPIARWRRS